MKIVWDEPKRLANPDKHGFDFDDVLFFDWSNAVIQAARPDRYGRPRFKAVGRFEGGTAVVVYAKLGTEAISIVSFRPANTRERKVLYGQTQTPH